MTCNPSSQFLPFETVIVVCLCSLPQCSLFLSARCHPNQKIDVVLHLWWDSNAHSLSRFTSLSYLLFSPYIQKMVNTIFRFSHRCDHCSTRKSAREVSFVASNWTRRSSGLTIFATLWRRIEWWRGCRSHWERLSNHSNVSIRIPFRLHWVRFFLRVSCFFLTVDRTRKIVLSTNLIFFVLLSKLFATRLSIRLESWVRSVFLGLPPSSLRCCRTRASLCVLLSWFSYRSCSWICWSGTFYVAVHWTRP